eukprot:18723_1
MAQTSPIHDSNNVLDTFTPSDLDDMENAMKNKGLNWMNITNCVNQELYPKLGSAIQSIITHDEFKIKFYDLSNRWIDKIIDTLKTKRHLDIEERLYLRKLCQRAQEFIPITNDNRKQLFVNDENKIDYQKDFHAKYKGLNRKMMQDIFDTHRLFRFDNYHFDEYSVQQ